jgi:UDP-N-acetylmuramate dehydrogenase
MQKLWQIVQKINIDPRRALFDEPMRDHTTFRIGGPADIFLKINSVNELSSALKLSRDEKIPCFILGGGANLLVGDKGIRGIVLDLSGLSGMVRTSTGLCVKAGSTVDATCENALALGLGGGLADFFGMPGTLGGAIYMNARCYGRDIFELVESLTLLSPEGKVSEFSPGSAAWGYKKSPFMPGGGREGFTVVEIKLRAEPENPLAVARLMRERRADRIKKGHYRFPSAGSMFKNDRRFGEPTGVILDRLGLKGCRVGDAAISPYHANIFVNLGAATARDMRALVEKSQDLVQASLGEKPEPEVLFVGEF